MRKPLQLAALPLAFAFACSTTGCTLFPPKNPPNLATATSAEQYERILWQMVQKQQWSKIPPLFSTTLVWNADGKSLGATQVVPYLQSLNLKDAVVINATVEPNGPDMTVAYTLQYSSNGGQEGCGTTYSALSVWQQMKNGTYILIAHSQQPNGSGCASSILVH